MTKIRERFLQRLWEEQKDKYNTSNLLSDEKDGIIRTLLNTRPPMKADADLLSLEKEYLSLLRADEKITDISDISPSSPDGRLHLWQGDITLLKIDAIVNAANKTLLGCFLPGHHCIDNAIHTFAGMELRLKCDEIMKKQAKPEETGCAKATGAYALPAKHIIHTVGPIVAGSLSPGHEKQLESSYNSVLKVADDLELCSIAFCCISTGEFAYPADKASKTAIKTVLNYLEKNPNTNIKKIVFNVFKDEDREIYEANLKNLS